MDYILVRPPQYTIFILCALIHYNRAAILSLKRKSELQTFTLEAHAVDIQSILEHALRISKNQKIVQIVSRLQVFQADRSGWCPITLGRPGESGGYPLFVGFPRTAVDHHLAEYERLREEEEQYLRQRKLAADLQEHTDRMRVLEEQEKLDEQLMEQVKASFTARTD